MHRAYAVPWRAGGLAGLWLVFFPEPGPAWAVGAVIVSLAVWRSLVLVPPRAGGLNLRWLVLPPLFFWESAGSALQVAHRALWPRARVEPAAMTYRPRARSPTSTMALSWVISALPGTLVGDLGDRELSIHVLDQRQPVTRDIGRMERYIAWAMRERWDEPGEGAPCKPS